MKPFKETQAFLRQVLMPFIGFVSIVTLVALFFKNMTILYGFLFGTFFSLIGFHLLIKSQLFLLQKQKKGLVIVQYFLRLFVYAVPVIMGLKNPHWFYLPTIIIGLFTFQVSFIIMEFINNLKKFKSHQ